MAYAFDFPKHYYQDFSSLIPSDHNNAGSLSDTVSERWVRMLSLHLLVKEMFWGRRQKTSRNSASDPQFKVNNIYYKFASVLIKRKWYRCSYGKISCFAMAFWNDDVFWPPPTSIIDAGHRDSKLRPIKFVFDKHFFKI